MAAALDHALVARRLRPARRAGRAARRQAPGRLVAAGGVRPARVRWGRSGCRSSYIAYYKAGRGLQDVTDVVWIAALGIHYKLALTGLNVFLLA